MTKIRALIGDVVGIAPVIAFFLGYHKYLMDKLDKKIDSKTYIRERDISYEYQSKSGENILRVLNQIENRIERIEQRLMN